MQKFVTTAGSKKSMLGSKKKKILNEHLACFLCIYLLNTYEYSFICIQAQTYFTFEWYICTYLKKKISLLVRKKEHL